MRAMETVYHGRGQPPKPRPAPLYTVKEVIASLPASAWQTIRWREGTKGTMQVQAVALRVQWATGSSLHSTSHSRVYTGPEGWLLAERPVPEAVADDSPLAPVEPQEFPHAFPINTASACWRGFSPLRDAKLAAWRASTGAALAVPGSRALASPDRSDPNLPSSEKLTK